MFLRRDTIFFAIFGLVYFVQFTCQTESRDQPINPHLAETKFNFKEYVEYPDNDERERGPDASSWSDNRDRGSYSSRTWSQSTPAPGSSASEETDSNIVWDSKWPSNMQFGQVSAVSIDLQGNVGIFHRGSRVWDTGSFSNDNIFDKTQGPISEKTVVLVDKEGNEVVSWGNGVFYMPHGLTIDYAGNYWITDVALHQVFKFDAKDLPKNKDELRAREMSIRSQPSNASAFGNSVVRPSMVLGEAFDPGNDERRFCKPTGVAVLSNGDFFVSDGYCNSRIIKFNARGERILTWGRKWGEIQGSWYLVPPPNAFFVPHALAVAEDLNYIFVADREHGRVVCFFTNNGTFHKEYRSPVIGSRIFSVAYANQKLYVVNGKDYNRSPARLRGYVLDVSTGNIVSQFSPGKDMQNPHDIAVSNDSRFIYVVEYNPNRAYKFSQDINSTTIGRRMESTENGHASATSVLHEHASLSDAKMKIEPIQNGVTATTMISSLVIAAVVFIVLCVAVAALVARCRKRGCLLSVRRSMRWDLERRENFKLSKLLESRRGKKSHKFFDERPNTRDFSKLNTEPETSDEEAADNSLTKNI